MRLAVLDDDKELCGQVAMLLRDAGHTCFEYHQGEALRRALRRESFDLLVMDWELPDVSGVELVGWAKENLSPAPPVIMLTGRTGEEDIVKGLDVGADDYVTKPLVPSVLKARVEALLRRSYGASDEPKVEEFGEHRFDPLTMTVTWRGDPITLTAKEFGLALVFFRNLNRPLSRAYIMETVWGRNPDIPSRTLDAHVSQIRGRLGLRPENGLRLASVYSFGYRLERLEAIVEAG
ncbi:MAG: response regulator transcription factor [Polymorphobacter sp.]|uniref:response regulator transcription factor n=1 Tax=Polymorphobacter sp. TaxID=1909290 RepID=UPI003A8A42DF